MKKYIARAPLSVLGRDIRPGDTFTVDKDEDISGPADGWEAPPQPNPEAERAGEVARRKRFEAEEAEATARKASRDGRP